MLIAKQNKWKIEKKKEKMEWSRQNFAMSFCIKFFLGQSCHTVEVFIQTHMLHEHTENGIWRWCNNSEKVTLWSFFSLLLHKQIAYKTNSCCFEANLSELNVLNHFCNPTVLYLASPAAFPPPLIPLAKLEAASAFTKVQLWFQLLFCKRKWMLRFFLCGMVVIKLWCSYLSFR